MLDAGSTGQVLEMIERLVTGRARDPRVLLRIREDPTTRLMPLPIPKCRDQGVGKADGSFGSFGLEFVLDLEVQPGDAGLPVDLISFQVQDLPGPSPGVGGEVDQRLPARHGANPLGPRRNR